MFQIGLKWNWPLFSQPQRLVEQRRKFHCRVIARLWGEFTTDTDPQKLWTSIAFQNKQLEPVFNLAQGGPRLGFLLANLISEPRTNSPEWVLVISSALTRWLIRIWAFVVLGHILGGHCVIPCSTSLLRFCLQSFLFFLSTFFFLSVFLAFEPWGGDLDGDWLLPIALFSVLAHSWRANSPSLWCLFCQLWRAAGFPVKHPIRTHTRSLSLSPCLRNPLPLSLLLSLPAVWLRPKSDCGSIFSAQIHEIISSPLPLFFSAS